MAENLIYKAYQHLRHWEPEDRIFLPQEIVDSNLEIYPLFSYCYRLMRLLYKQLPRRKNGQAPVIHPINVVWALQKAKVNDPIVLCAGLLHDYVEERVDLLREEQNIAQTKEGKHQLDTYERQVFKELEASLKHLCTQSHLSLKPAKTIIQILHLLTRHKRHFYYRSISAIFDCPDKVLKERALQVKLADRLHNILCLNTFNEQERLYQCFKNLFILNNAKKFLKEEYGKKVLLGIQYSATEKLFNKCARATYDAFVQVCHDCSKQGISSITPMLQLAFKKFALEKSGLWAVTEVNDQEVHLLRLYQGVIRKFDARLHHERREYEQMKQKELSYLRIFFRDYHFSEIQLQALLCYKDAYSLKEVVAYLIYQPDYALSHFLCSELSKNGRIK